MTLVYPPISPKWSQISPGMTQPVMRRRSTNWRKVGAAAVPAYLPLPEPSSVPISVPTQLATILYTNLPPTALAMIAMDHRTVCSELMGTSTISFLTNYQVIK